jgi:flagellar assembly factor FliW
MLIQTTRFGPLDVDESKVITFPEGLPGFNHVKDYVIIPIPQYYPFHCMQAVNQPDLAFAVADPWELFPDYMPQIGDDDEAFLELRSPNDAAVYVMAVIPPDLKNITVNLMAPLVINAASRKGRQVIVFGNYSTRERLPHQQSIAV